MPKPYPLSHKCGLKCSVWRANKQLCEKAKYHVLSSYPCKVLYILTCTLTSCFYKMEGWKADQQ